MSSHRTWLCGIAKNKLYEYYRKQILLEKNQVSDTENLSELSSDFNLENTVLSIETKAQVQQALETINPVYRYSLVMKYIDGYSIKQIGKLLGRTTKAADGVLQKAKSSFIKEYSRIAERGISHE
jgi:RNA polymerase sigma-70 factor (ECF subfamily)